MTVTAKKRKGSEYIEDMLKLSKEFRQMLFASEPLINLGHSLQTYSCLTKLGNILGEELERQKHHEEKCKTTFAKGSKVTHKDGRQGIINAEAEPQSDEYLCIDFNGSALMWKPEDIV